MSTGTNREGQFRKSKVANLVVHRGGVYYARAKVGGKTVRESLETSDYNEAVLRLPARLDAMRKAAAAPKAGTLLEAVAAEAARESPDIRPASAHYYKQVAASIARDLVALGIAEKRLSKVTRADLNAWRDRYAAKASPTRVNGAISLLRKVFGRAVEAGNIGRNPAAELKRMRPRKRRHQLPDLETFATLVENIRP